MIERLLKSTTGMTLETDISADDGVTPATATGEGIITINGTVSANLQRATLS